MSIGKPLRLFAGVALTLLSRLLLRMRVLKPVDGWRRGAGLVLKGDAATFVLSAFNLNALSDRRASEDLSIHEIEQHVAHRLDMFLRGEPEFHLLIRHEQK